MSIFRHGLPAEASRETAKKFSQHNVNAYKGKSWQSRIFLEYFSKDYSSSTVSNIFGLPVNLQKELRDTLCKRAFIFQKKGL